MALIRAVLLMTIIFSCNLSLAQINTALIIKDNNNDSMVFQGMNDSKENLMQLIANKNYKKYIDDFKVIYQSDSAKNNYNYSIDLYNLACAYTKLKRYDEAFQTLKIISEKLRFDDAYVLGDYDLEVLHHDARWKEFEKTIRNNYLTRNKNITHPELAIQLSTWNGVDQSSIQLTETVDGRKIFRQKNRSLVNNIIEVFEKYGYPTPKMVGQEAYVPALIIAHADYGTQLMYKDFLYKEAIKGNIPGGMAGVVIDKILVKQEKPQLYGTQGCLDSVTKKTIPCPIHDIEHIEERRRKVGFLTPWSEYLKLQESINK